MTEFRREDGYEVMVFCDDCVHFPDCPIFMKWGNTTPPHTFLARDCPDYEELIGIDTDGNLYLWKKIFPESMDVIVYFDSEDEALITMAHLNGESQTLYREKIKEE